MWPQSWPPSPRPATSNPRGPALTLWAFSDNRPWGRQAGVRQLGACGVCLSAGGSRPQARHPSQLTVGTTPPERGDAGNNVSNPPILCIGMSSDWVGLINCTVRAAPRTLPPTPPPQKPWEEGGLPKSAGPGFLPKGEREDREGPRRESYKSQQPAESFAPAGKTFFSAPVNQKSHAASFSQNLPRGQPHPIPWSCPAGALFQPVGYSDSSGQPAPRDACEHVLSTGRAAKPAGGHQERQSTVLGEVASGSENPHTGIAPQHGGLPSVQRDLPCPAHGRQRPPAWRNNPVWERPQTCSPSMELRSQLNVESGDSCPCRFPRAAPRRREPTPCLGPHQPQHARHHVCQPRRLPNELTDTQNPVLM